MKRGPGNTVAGLVFGGFGDAERVLDAFARVVSVAVAVRGEERRVDPRGGPLLDRRDGGHERVVPPLTSSTVTPAARNTATAASSATLTEASSSSQRPPRSRQTRRTAAARTGAPARTS